MLGHYNALGNSGYKLTVNLLDKLDIFSTKLTAKYHTLLKLKKCPASTPLSDGGFNVEVHITQTHQLLSLYRMAYSLQLQTICKKYGVKWHPHKYCGDSGACIHPFCPCTHSPSSNCCLNNNQHMPQPELWSPIPCCEFKNKVHNLLLEAL